MDAKSKAEFINAVGSGTIIPCPKCGTQNKPDCKFCFACGTELSVPKDTPPAVAPTENPPVQSVKYVEPNNAFAQGLPEWSVEPPQVMIRRH